MKLIDKASEREIVETIRQAESATRGEIRVHVRRLASRDVMKDAQKFFRKTRMHRTRERNGVLIFISWNSRAFAILGDEGIHRVAGDTFWNQTRDRMKEHFSKQELKEGILAGVKSAGEKLKAYFPRSAGNHDELPDMVTEG